MKELNTTTEEYPEREIKLIVIHCSATRCTLPFTPAQLEQCHKSQGMSGTGYHFYITRDGGIHHTRPIYKVGAHARGFNLHSVGICYEGGLDADGIPCDTRTSFQRVSLLDVIRLLKQQYPDARVVGHCQLSADIHKACPCFDAEKEYEAV